MASEQGVKALLVVGSILLGGFIAAASGQDQGLAIGAIVAVVGAAAGLMSEFANGKTRNYSSEDDRAESDVSESADLESSIARGASENEDSEIQTEQMLTADGAGAENPQDNIPNNKSSAIIENEMEESEQVKQDAEKVNEIQNKVDKLLNEENQLKQKLEQLGQSSFGNMGESIEKSIESGEVEKVVTKLNQLGRDEEIAVEDLEKQAQDLKEVIELEEESKEVVEDQKQHLENQLQYEKKALEHLRDKSNRGADHHQDEEVGQMVTECENRINRTKKDIQRSKKVLEEIEEVEALENDHAQKVEAILEMEQS